MCTSMPSFADMIVDGSGLSATGEILMAPDWSSLVPSLPYYPEHAAVQVIMTQLVCISCDTAQTGFFIAHDPLACCAHSVCASKVQSELFPVH